MIHDSNAATTRIELRREVEDHLRLRGPEEGRGKGRGREAGGDERTQVSIEHP